MLRVAVVCGVVTGASEWGVDHGRHEYGRSTRWRAVSMSFNDIDVYRREAHTFEKGNSTAVGRCRYSMEVREKRRVSTALFLELSPMSAFESIIQYRLHL